MGTDSPIPLRAVDAITAYLITNIRFFNKMMYEYTFIEKGVNIRLT